MPPIPSDFILAKSGDSEALDRILQRNEQRLASAARQEIAGNLHAKINTSDLLQSTYLRVLTSIQDFEGEDDASFVGWARRILQNLARDKARYFSARMRDRERESTEAEEFQAILPYRNPDSRLSIREDVMLVHRAMRSLPEDQRRILEWKVFEGLSHREIGERLGRSLTSTRSLLARARARIVLEVARLRAEID